MVLLPGVPNLAGNDEGPRIDDLPLYGQPRIPRPDSLKKADAAFIAQAVSGFGGNRKAACIAWCREGDKFLDELNLDFAMRRYNQGWLLNPESYLPFLGFARVLLQQDKFDESLDYFERALALLDEPAQRTALLADTGTAYSFKAKYQPNLGRIEQLAAFAKANECFAQSTTLNPKNGNAWKRWAMSLEREGNFPAAWNKVREAKANGITIFPAGFLEALRKDMPEPK